MKKLDTKTLTKIIEKDAGVKIPGLLTSLEQSARGEISKSLSPIQLTIKAARLEVGLSQNEFAKAIGIKVATLRDWEQGRFEPPLFAMKIFRLLIKNPSFLDTFKAA